MDDSPTLAELKAILREQGTGAAITRLEELAAADRGVLAQAHPLVHSLGKYSFTVYKSAPKAFGQCRESFESGCYHGVLQAYFASKKNVTPAEISGLCDAAVGTGSVNQRFQCVHGLGHGLTSSLEYRLFDALQSCDYLKTDWDQRSCYGGVFMENVMFAREFYFGIVDTPAPAQQHDHRAGFKAFVSADDPLYPCTAVDERYRPECYVMQPSIMLLANNFSFSRAFQICDTAPARDIPMCYEGVGREITGYTLREPAASLRLCMQGNPAHRTYCMTGVVKNFINADLKTDKALTFCATVPGESKTACYTAMGEQVATIHADLSARAAECAKAEAAFRDACGAGAGLTRRS